jgi:sulfur carrier protein ThiS
VHLHLGGHLGWYDPQKRSRLVIPLSEPILLSELLEQLEIPRAEIAVATINRLPVELGRAQVSDSDSVELFPPVGGGSRARRAGAEKESIG